MCCRTDRYVDSRLTRAFSFYYSLTHSLTHSLTLFTHSLSLLYLLHCGGLAQCLLPGLTAKDSDGTPRDAFPRTARVVLREGGVGATSKLAPFTTYSFGAHVSKTTTAASATASPDREASTKALLYPAALAAPMALILWREGDLIVTTAKTRVRATGHFNGEALSFAWSVHAAAAAGKGKQGGFEDTPLLSAPFSAKAYLTLAPGLLAQGASFEFRVRVRPSSGGGAALQGGSRMVIHTDAPPTLQKTTATAATTMSAAPASGGVEFSTEFSVDCGEWLDDPSHSPLSYQLVDAATGDALTPRQVASPRFEGVVLPPGSGSTGLLSVACRVWDSLGAWGEAAMSVGVARIADPEAAVATIKAAFAGAARLRRLEVFPAALRRVRELEALRATSRRRLITADQQQQQQQQEQGQGQGEQQRRRLSTFAARPIGSDSGAAANNAFRLAMVSASVADPAALSAAVAYARETFATYELAAAAATANGGGPGDTSAFPDAAVLLPAATALASAVAHLSVPRGGLGAATATYMSAVGAARAAMDVLRRRESSISSGSGSSSSAAVALRSSMSTLVASLAHAAATLDIASVGDNSDEVCDAATFPKGFVGESSSIARQQTLWGGGTSLGQRLVVSTFRGDAGAGTGSVLPAAHGVSAFSVASTDGRATGCETTSVGSTSSQPFHYVRLLFGSSPAKEMPFAAAGAAAPCVTVTLAAAFDADGGTPPNWEFGCAVALLPTDTDVSGGTALAWDGARCATTPPAAGSGSSGGKATTCVCTLCADDRVDASDLGTEVSGLIGIPPAGSRRVPAASSGGLDGGAVAGIVLGCMAVLGAGAFAVQQRLRRGQAAWKSPSSSTTGSPIPPPMSMPSGLWGAGAAGMGDHHAKGQGGGAADMPIHAAHGSANKAERGDFGKRNPMFASARNLLSRARGKSTEQAAPLASDDAAAAAAAAGAATSSGAMVASTPLPAGWKAATDGTSGNTYYFHCDTGEVTWIRPTLSIV